MEGVEKIHILIEELAEAVRDVFPEATTACFFFDDEGYRDIDVMKWEKNNDFDSPLEGRKREKLLSQQRVPYEGIWTEDKSEFANCVYRERGIFLNER